MNVIENQAAQKPIDEQVSRFQSMYALNPKSLSSHELHILCLYNPQVEAEVSALKANELGLPGCQFDGRTIWVPINNFEDAPAIKTKLRNAGFPNVRSFEGVLEENGPKRPVVHGELSAWFSDRLGISQKLHDTIFAAVKVTPIYVYAFSNTIIVDCYSPADAKAVEKLLVDAGVKDIKNGKDNTNSVDIWQVRSDLPSALKSEV